MILINLLPYREERRKRRKTAFFAGLGLAGLVGAGFVVAAYLLLEFLTQEQQARNQYIQSAVAQLEAQIKDIANLKAEIESLKSRQKAVEDLQTDRNTPVQLLNDLARLAPEGIYLTAIRQDNKLVTVSGLAQTNERVSEFLRNVSRNSEWLEKPDLIEVKLATVSTNTRDQRRLLDFSMKVSIKVPPTEATPGMPAASGPKKT
ncbi:PilN domain-containing protein [Roseateles saccharophilus]|uniref:Type IV pilus assembly protein PilN n=1 Tax=Roseateles saccharophilus TaxID=304 RepID=A0A4R3UJ70_ROSSA|nr:PilN domain-containing protein [Roseateles saccharophilus]MDG0834084.1 fimbrial assembly protein [Roseateles saccharophilus]TCU90812.1 type IV pilus assembly protein PilN [Roseateles saccharophilus]